MARITVEDCLPFVKNRFELVLLASKRARQIAMGSRPLVPDENDKPAVIALRENRRGAHQHGNRRRHRDQGEGRGPLLGVQRPPALRVREGMD